MSNLEVTKAVKRQDWKFGPPNPVRDPYNRDHVSYCSKHDQSNKSNAIFIENYIISINFEL